MTTTVAIGGLGAIGLPLARALDSGVEGLTLIAVAARDHAKAKANLTRFRNPAAHRRPRCARRGGHRRRSRARRGVRAHRLAGDRGRTHSRARLGRARCCRACT